TNKNIFPLPPPSSLSSLTSLTSPAPIVPSPVKQRGGWFRTMSASSCAVACSMAAEEPMWSTCDGPLYGAELWPSCHRHKTTATTDTSGDFRLISGCDPGESPSPPLPPPLPPPELPPRGAVMRFRPN
ncbi:hypothetical protein INR49_010749, partial [Caranx melampygus]